MTKVFGSAVLLALTIASSPAHAQTAPGRGAAATTPVAHEKLVALLPAIAGWTKGEPEGELTRMGPLTMSVGRADYEKGDLSLTLEITDTLANQMLMGPFMAGLSAAGTTRTKTESGWAQKVTIGGFPGVEVFDSEDKRADVMVILDGRFVVRATIADVQDTAAAKAAVEAVNLKALAALK
jgi:hypothetical protein